MSEHARMYRSFSGGSLESFAGLALVLTGTVVVSVDILTSGCSYFSFAPDEQPDMFAQGLVNYVVV